MRDVGIPFAAVPSRAEEVSTGDDASTLASENARAKAEGAVLPPGVLPGAFVLGTDTLVTAGGVVMGKPSSAAEAAAMLAALSGRTHEVVSGVALVRLAEAGLSAAGPQAWVATAVTAVTFLPLSAARIEAYVASGEWKGKAGAYAIQGLAGLFVREVRGEYSNVVGLPVCLLAHLFEQAGFDVVRREWRKTGRRGEIVTAPSQWV